MALRSIEEEWNDFAQQVFRGRPIGHVQHVEMKKAFFAGAFVVHCMMREIGEPHVSEAAALVHLEKIGKEFDRYFPNADRN